ncbi:hypothetical protein N7462_005285 [Penicillium macrosclerotiorum]|uniref:uncharacterized protein n=1 Tax=Penicillium macrosclerotiorum TaxID=303699 RepID=UPI0025475EEE|nr:uncharacterized protein N7462_005285 [Penicillium macrosclerotiorum]KAJ5690893.1 hypothetical protein N7462_005285 [Penicillium macrosclerotiorum]
MPATQVSMIDPLVILPPEVVLRILEFAPVADVAALTAVSKAWHQFIDLTHQQAIYASESKTLRPPQVGRDISFLSESHSFSNFFKGTASWKDLCRRQTVLARNWSHTCPESQESVLQVGNDPIWRFRPDFKRRFFVSTSHAGGLNVTDMDSGRILWRLPSSLDHGKGGVRPYAHLEYQDGMAVFDRTGDAVEVWQADLEGLSRGEFRRIAVLNHDCQTRGFQLSHWTLCVVSNQGQGFVYDMTQRPPKLTTHLKIEPDAVGHLDQTEDTVIYSMGPRGYDAYDKRSGGFLGTLQPSHCKAKYHIRHPVTTSPSAAAALAGAARRSSHRFSHSTQSRRDHLMPIQIEQGPLPAPVDPEHVWHGEDEWGAGMLDGDLFVGFSRAGRIFICSDWRKALRDRNHLIECSSLLECESDGSGFDLGGWLAVRNHRVMFEIQDRIYVVGLNDENNLTYMNTSNRASYSLLTSSAPQLAVPVSFMTLCDDAILTTFTTLGWRQSLSDIPGDTTPLRFPNPERIFPTKTIRVLSLAPNHSKSQFPATSLDDLTRHRTPSSRETSHGLPEDYQSTEEMWHSEASLLQLVDLLGDDLAAQEDELDNQQEWP